MYDLIKMNGRVIDYGCTGQAVDWKCVCSEILSCYDAILGKDVWKTGRTWENYVIHLFFKIIF